MTDKAGFRTARAPQAGIEAQWARSREARVRLALRFPEHGYAPFSEESLKYLKSRIEKLAPKQHAADRSALFQHFEKRASAQDRYFVYLTLFNRLRHRKGPPGRRRGRPRRGTERAPSSEVHEVRQGRLVRLRARGRDLGQARLFSDLHAFLRPVYKAKKSYERLAKLFHAVFGRVIDPASVEREIFRNRQS